MGQGTHIVTMADFRIRNMSEDLRRKLRIRAAEEDMNMNDLVKKLLQEALDKPTKK